MAHPPPLTGRLLGAAPLAVLGVLATAAYAVLPWQRGAGRWAAGREWPGAKLPWIALTWAVLSVALPAFLLGADEWPAGWGWAFAGQAAFVAGITVPFDVRDLGVDAPGMRTLPQLAGPSRSIRMALCMVAFSAAAFLIADPAAGRWLVSVAALLAVAVGSVPRKPGYYDGLLDGLLAAQALALLI